MTTLDTLPLLGSAILVLVGAWLTFYYRVRQRNYEALLEAKIRHYELIAPLLNKIFRFRQRVGDYLELAPEDVLRAKREADEEFHVHLYIWSDEFRRAYVDFMDESFLLYVRPHALIRAQSMHYEPRPADAGWKAFSDEAVDPGSNEMAYRRVMVAIAGDLPFDKPRNVWRWLLTADDRRAPTEPVDPAVAAALRRERIEEREFAE